MGLLDKLFGKGDAWKEKGWAAEGDTREWAGHHAVIDHARKIGFPGPMAPAGSDKKTWTEFTNRLNAWKASGMPQGGGGISDSGEGVGYSGGGLSGPLGGWFSPDNIYFPQLVQEYTRPTGNDYRDLFAAYGLTGPLAQMEGAYTPGTVQGAALVPGGILEYQPPQIRTGLPTFIGNPYGSLQLPEDWESLLDLGEEEEEDDDKPTEGSGGGKGDKSGDPVGGVLGTTSPAEKY
jgi:hypothetical protein